MSIIGHHGVMMTRASSAAPELPFLPLVWLDGADAATFTLSGTDVESWANKGTAGGDFTPLDTPRCSRISDGVNINNGVTSSAAPAALTRPIYSDSNGSAWTYFLVTSDIGDMRFSRFMNFDPGGIFRYQTLSANNTGALIESSSNYSFVASTGVGFDWNKKNVVMGKFSGSSPFPADVDINNGEYVNTGSGSGTNSNFANQFCVGASRNSNGAPYGCVNNGNVHEVVAYNSALSAPDIAAVHAYLSAKWGL